MSLAAATRPAPALSQQAVPARGRRIDGRNALQRDGCLGHSQPVAASGATRGDEELGAHQLMQNLR